MSSFLPPASPAGAGLSSLVAYALLVLGTLAALLFVARRVGERRPSVEKARPYESGVVPTGEALVLRPLPFYRVAIFFLLFDVEAAFLFTWAVAYDRLAWGGFVEIAFFIAVLLLGLVYICKKRGLEWGTSSSASSTH
ncbi:MAG: NADH-quinone oxidoreductase subunit A [Deltaproteobacteria bacterium]|nr:NADH-quinone oxidoreductase subunit A [Deltaproteobacteria bacterium]